MHLGQLGGISDGLGTRVEVAQTARRKTHSGLLVGLEEPDGHYPGWDHEHHAQPSGRANQDEAENDEGGDASKRKSVLQASSPLARADVRHARGFGMPRHPRFGFTRTQDQGPARARASSRAPVSWVAVHGACGRLDLYICPVPAPQGTSGAR
jgi:hypothetical protein